MRTMRFAVVHTNGSSERLCTLSGFAKSPNTVIETPTAALFTKGGSVVHLTADVLSRVFSSPQLLWVPLSNAIHLEAGARGQNEGVAKFAGLGGHFSCVSLHDSNEVTPSGHFERDAIPLWTRNGKQLINADRYMDVVEAFKPDMILAIADGRTSLLDGHKRISKSVERTCNMFDRCIKRYKSSSQLTNSSLVGVLVGSSRKSERERCLNRILAHKDVLHGVALSGLTEGGPQTHRLTMDLVEPIFKDVAESLPSNLFRIVDGCWNPAVTLAAVAHGFDFFDGAYPAKLTNSGHALVFQFSVNEVQSNAAELCILNLNDERYKEDFRPLLENCKCLTCCQHTRAYINHLLVTREMLAPVLLTIHNLHHYDQMFCHIRKHIAESTFNSFRSLITRQYELYSASQTEIESEVANVQCQKVKKKRLNNPEETVD